MSLHKCPRCSYSSYRLFDLRRHLRRKVPCFRSEADNNTITHQDNDDPYSRHSDPETALTNPEAALLTSKAEEPNPETVSQSSERKTQCDKCRQTFSNHSNYIRHISKQRCRGCEATVCAVCFKRFKSTTARSTHNRRVKCTQCPSSESYTSEMVHASTINNNINNTTNNNSINNTTNNINNSQNLNIHLNFGEEALEKLCSQPDYLKRMERIVRLGKYALPQHISDIYFNELFPMNNTIMKTRHNDRFVKIKTGENQWNLRAVDDVYKTLTERMEDYMTPYFKHVEKQMEKIYDRDQSKFNRLTRSIREFGHKVLWLDWKCEDIRQIGVELNDPYCENERHRRIQEMKSLLLEHIYDKTREMLSLE